MKNKLMRALEGKSENHILPFFWQHGEDDSVLIDELHRIYDSGIRAVCAESRPHEGFVTDAWWDDMELLLKECRRLDMDMWILDDKYFPTGFCNGAIPKKYPERCKRALIERHVDVCGPLSDGAVILEGWAEEEAEDELFAVIACRAEEDGSENLAGECIDLTDRVSDGLVSVDLPWGMWRIFFIFERPERDGRVDFTNPESADTMISEIYEPHFEHLGKYFGNTFKGFFSDEPFIMDRSALPVRGANNSHGKYPWNRYIMSELASRFGSDWRLYLPALWFTMKGVSPRYRVAYMDSVTMLYRRHFSMRVGDWCRSHGVEYIGHIVEDNNIHTTMNSGGHYFRSLDGQDMGGVDVVLHQIVPGMTNHPNACNCWYDIADPDFFHFSLAKLASSHSHIQPEKHGRAMCEIYGAYGFAEGLKIMKWLTDHMLVRGINNFVPHAFSPQFPDEVPPQFYCQGHNPQFRHFRLIMEYMNRVSDILSDGVHRASCAVLYHAEAEWSGGDYMYYYTPARLLTEGNIDFDIISADYLAKARTDGSRLCLADETYPCLIVPRAEYLPESVICDIRRVASAGVEVVFLDAATEHSAEHPSRRISLDDTEHIHVIPAGDLVVWMRGHGMYDITASEDTRYLRFYHYSMGGTDAYMLTNEGIRDDIATDITFSAFDGGDYVLYRPFENRAYAAHSANRTVSLSLKPYESVILFFGDIPDGMPEYTEYEIESETEPETEFTLSLFDAERYPSEPLEVIPNAQLKNVTSPDMFPRFGGYMEYRGTLEYSGSLPQGKAKCTLDLGRVGESAEVVLNGENVGVRICPPYTFDITKALRSGTNELTVTVANHLGYEQRDLCSKYLALEPSGLMGPIRILTELPSDR